MTETKCFGLSCSQWVKYYLCCVCCGPYFGGLAIYFNERDKKYKRVDRFKVPVETPTGIPKD